MKKISLWSNRYIRAAIAAVFWLAVWQAASMLLNRPILLVSPMEALKKLLELSVTGGFWLSVGTSFLRIAVGFFSGVAAGAALAVLSAASKLARALIYPLASVIKSTPVVSFIIFALLWIDSKNLATFISFLMVLPIMYIGSLSGIESADRKLLEAARVFKMRPIDRARYIFLPAAAPQFLASVSVALGLSWKSGIAAEVIGLPEGTLGERLYEAKLYLNTAELFAYTFVIIVLSALFEHIVKLITNKAFRKISAEAEK